MGKYAPIILLGIFYIIQFVLGGILYYLKTNNRIKNKVVNLALTVTNSYIIIAIPLAIITFFILEEVRGDIVGFILIFFVIGSILVFCMYGIVVIIFACDNITFFRIILPLVVVTIIFEVGYYVSNVKFVTKNVMKEEHLDLLYVNEFPVLEEISSDEIISLMQKKINNNESQENKFSYWYFDENDKAKNDSIENEKVILDFLDEGSLEDPYLKIVTNVKETVRIEQKTGKETIEKSNIETQEYYFYLPEFLLNYVILN